MSMHLLADHCAERGMILLEDAKGRGFIIWQYKQPVCHIREIYVRPEDRRKGVASAMTDLCKEYAKEAGCTHLYSQIGISTEGAMQSLAMHLAYGARVAEARNDVLVMEYKI